MTISKRITNEWLNNIDSEKVNIIMFFDPEKAFDTVNHEILLKNFLSMVRRSR